MEMHKHRSVFQSIRSSELSGFRVREPPYFVKDSLQYSEIGALEFGHEEDLTPPLALSFCKTSRNAHIVAVTGEDGFVRLYNTRLKFPSSATVEENADKAKICEWTAHDNAIFDVCWTKDDTNLLTACGDHSIKLWDSQEQKCIAALIGHTGSVKSISVHPFNNDIIASGSRDGTFALWDLRCSKRRRTHSSTSPIDTVVGAHNPRIIRTRGRHAKVAPMSVTSVLYLKEEVTVATAGAADGIIKFWDTRNLNAPTAQVGVHGKTARKWVRPYGISSLSQDLNGEYISASSMDSRIYLYNVLRLDKGPTASFTGCDIGSFFVKASLSPDAGHILSGSSDGNAYVWQVNNPEATPMVLNGHSGEVMAVDWCSSEVGKIATSADDSVVRLWNINSSCHSNTRQSIRQRRVSMFPSMQGRNLSIEEPTESLKGPGTPNPTPIPEVRTPKSIKTQPSISYMMETCERSPDASFDSPSSVLNPPPSLKRKTILDYFNST